MFLQRIQNITREAIAKYNEKRPHELFMNIIEKCEAAAGNRLTEFRYFCDPSDTKEVFQQVREMLEEEGFLVTFQAEEGLSKSIDYLMIVKW